MLLKPVPFIKGGDARDLGAFRFRTGRNRVAFLLCSEGNLSSSNLGCKQELRETSALFDDLHVPIFLTPENYFFIQSHI